MAASPDDRDDVIPMLEWSLGAVGAPSTIPGQHPALVAVQDGISAHRITPTPVPLDVSLRMFGAVAAFAFSDSIIAAATF